ARNGIVFKSGRHMEQLAALNTIVFDKTGTLTHGRPEIRDVISLDERLFPPGKIVSLAAAAETRLKHPASEAIVAKAQRANLNIADRIGAEFKIGLGVEARVNGYFIHVGSARFLRQNRIRLDACTTRMQEINEHGWSTRLFAVDGELKGLICYADAVRHESS